MNVNEIAELISLALTCPTIVLAFTVVILFWDSFKAAWNNSQRDSRDWFVLGVTIGFIATCLDNLYWSIPWTAKFLGLNITDTLMNAGVFFNIPFRQMLGCVAGYCHVRSWAEHRKEREHEEVETQWVMNLFLAALCLGLMLCCILVILHTQRGMTFDETQNRNTPWHVYHFLSTL